MAACRESEPGSVFLMQQPKRLHYQYLNGMASLGLTTIASCGYDLSKATTGKETLRILCIGLGGGSLPLFLANAIQGADIDIVEIDPLVISTTFQEMGFPALPVVASSGECAFPEHNIINKMLWGDVEKRLHLYENDGAKFIQDTSTVYDMIFIDADDGEGEFPRHLWDRQFLKALGDRLHPEHGTVLVYLEPDDDGDQDPESSRLSQIGREYKDVLVGNGSNCDPSGIGFIAEVDYGLATLVVSRGFWKEDSMDRNNKDSLKKILESKTVELIKLPSSGIKLALKNYEEKPLTLID